MTVTAQAGETFAGYYTLETIACHRCGVLFALPEKLLNRARSDPERTFYCPNGHSAHFPGETEEDRLRRCLKSEREWAARLASERDQLKASERAQRAAKTRAQRERDRERKRVGNGVCPCCNRTFVNLARHMAGQHPEHAHPAT
jgi:hypothetical protein